MCVCLIRPLQFVISNTIVSMSNVITDINIREFFVIIHDYHRFIVMCRFIINNINSNCCSFPPPHMYTVSRTTVVDNTRVPSIDNKSSLYVRDPVDLFIAECHLACLRPISVLRSIPQTEGKGIKKKKTNYKLIFLQHICIM